VVPSHPSAITTFTSLVPPLGRPPAPAARDRAGIRARGGTGRGRL